MHVYPTPIHHVSLEMWHCMTLLWLLRFHLLICITGGEGYLASHLVKQLLERGYTVRVTLLKNDEASSKHLKLLGAALPGHVELFEANCLTAGSYDQVAHGARYL